MFDSALFRLELLPQTWLPCGVASLHSRRREKKTSGRWSNTRRLKQKTVIKCNFPENALGKSSVQKWTLFLFDVIVRNAGGKVGGVWGATEDTTGRLGAVHQEGCLSGLAPKRFLKPAAFVLHLILTDGFLSLFAPAERRQVNQAALMTLRARCWSGRRW